jgi:hypothetical protein
MNQSPVYRSLPASLNLQPLDNPAVQQVFLDDFIDIFTVYIGVPDTFRVYDDYRPFLTAIKASRRVDPYASLAGKSQQLASLLGIVTHGLRIKALAARTAIRTVIYAEKNVVTIIVIA